MRFIVLCFLCCSYLLSAQQSWTDLVPDQLPLRNFEENHHADSYRLLRLNASHFLDRLAQAPLRGDTHGAAPVVIVLPMPDGTDQRFELVEAPTLHPDLGAKFPEIKSYAGTGIDDPTAYFRGDWSQRGFHGMILSGAHRGVYIDPYAANDTEFYTSYYRDDYHRDLAEPWSCETRDDGHHTPDHADLDHSRAGDCTLRKYRLALTCTGEYANFYGGTPAGVLAGMNTTMTRVNGLYERDLTVTMEIIPNNDTLLFFNAGTDPWQNNNPGQMINTITSVINGRISTSDYDIGHIFSTEGGGLAFYASVCTGNKARGVTGVNPPINDFFAVDYVAHEMGHQFGGSHTFNNSCFGNINPSTAAEPGSGSTIMAYAGICPPNVQNASSAYFHAISINEIQGNLLNGPADNCAEKIDLTNTQPVVSVPQNSYFVPVLTPFELLATAEDPDADTLTYTWEQMDVAQAPQPPSPNNTLGPLFRSRGPSLSSTRTFPPITNILNNQNPTWERIPAVTRGANFQVTVRDNDYLGGCTDEASVLLNFRETAGPFEVTYPNLSSHDWYGPGQVTVTWDVANTDVPPVDAQNVDIMISYDAGLTYPDTLAAGVPNDGEQVVDIPAMTVSLARVKIKASDNVFFDISNRNFSIVDNPFPVSAVVTQQVSCFTQPNDGIITIIATGGNEPYQYSIDDGATFQDSNVFENLDPGNYQALVVDADGATAETNPVSITVPDPLIVNTQIINGNQLLVSTPDNDGTITFSFNGTDFTNDTTFLDLPEGDYTILAVDTSGCSTTETVTIDLIDAVAIAEIIKTCPGEGEGQIVVGDVTGGVAPFLYALNDGPTQPEFTFTGLPAGTYEVTVIDANGSVFTVPDIQLTEFPLIVGQATVGNGSITVTASGGTGELSFSIDGFNFQADGFFEGLLVGVYDVTIMDEEGCILIVSAEVLVGNDNPLAASRFELSPNPTSGLLRLHLERPAPGTLRTELYDLTGKLLLRRHFTGAGTDFRTTLDLSGFAAGTYLLRVADDSGSRTEEVVLF